MTQEGRARGPGWMLHHSVTLAICLGILLVAATGSTTTEVVRLFGYDVPVLCTWRRWFGVSCPGCGLTRAFVFLAHGMVGEAARLNLLSLPLFLLVLSQVPYRIYALWRDRAR